MGEEEESRCKNPAINGTHWCKKHSPVNSHEKLVSAVTALLDEFHELYLSGKSGNPPRNPELAKACEEKCRAVLAELEKERV